MVMDDIADERLRQDELKRAGKFHWTCADTGIRDESKLAVLAEEFGEVARLVVEQLIDRTRREPEKLREELIQVAAVCAAWCEAIDKEEAASDFSVSDDGMSEALTRSSTPPGKSGAV